jgi:GNAT superfamily N-acetyltransferase
MDVADPPDTTTAASVHIRRVDRSALGMIRRLNTAIFEEQRIINTFDREDLLMLLAETEGEPVGFKIGYRLKPGVFYSAKGGVLDEHRENGVARALMMEMMRRVREQGYKRFTYDTFPNMHPGMAVLGLREGFRVTRADYNPRYEDYRLRLEKAL